MSVVSLLGVRVVNNPAPFTAPYEFEITFECLEQLQKGVIDKVSRERYFDLFDLCSNRFILDLEWKLTYVGSATSSEYDQELDSLLVGPIPVGVNKFIFEADPPDLKRIPTSEILGVTVILLTCSYDGREFVRVGYYVNNEYDSEELNTEPPTKPIIERVVRNVLAKKPRVTRFAIKWDSEDSAPAEYPPDQPDVDALDDDGTAYGAEEVELQAALEKELEELDREEANNDGMEIEGPAADEGNADEDDDDAGSEDLEEESSESEDEGDGDEDVEMGDGDPADNNQSDPKAAEAQQQSEVMVH